MNLLATLRLNFRLLPWRQALRLPIVVNGPLRIQLGPQARLELPTEAGRATVVLESRHETYKAGAGKGQFSLFGTWRVGGRVRIGLDSCLYIHAGATFATGKDVFIARDSQIECASQIILGDRVLMGETYLCDTAAHPVAHGEEPQPMMRPVSIASDCYFGYRTMVLRGAQIPPHSVVGSGAVCTRDFCLSHPAGHLLLVGVPAQVKATDVTPDCHIV